MEQKVTPSLAPGAGLHEAPSAGAWARPPSPGSFLERFHLFPGRGCSLLAPAFGDLAAQRLEYAPGVSRRTPLLGGETPVFRSPAAAVGNVNTTGKIALGPRVAMWAAAVAKVILMQFITKPDPRGLRSPALQPRPVGPGGVIGGKVWPRVAAKHAASVVFCPLASLGLGVGGPFHG